MFRPRFASFLLVLSFLALEIGCTTSRPLKECFSYRVFHKSVLEKVEISGSVVPPCRAEVPEEGCSLADCLTQSRVMKLLELGGRFRENLPTVKTGEVPTESDLVSLNRLVSSFSGTSDPVDSFNQLVSEFRSLQVRVPSLEVPSSWQKGFPHYILDDRTGTEVERVFFLRQVEAINDPVLKRVAVSALDRQFSGNRAGNELKVLSRLIADRKIEPTENQKIMGWCYQALRSVISQTNDGGSDDGDIIQWDPSKLNTQQTEKNNEQSQRSVSSTHFKPSSFQGPSPSLKAQSVSGTSAESGSGKIDEAIMAIVRKSNGTTVVVPLELVFVSPVGGYQVYPGDRILLVRFKELPFSVKSYGTKKVGVLGLAKTKGVAETDASSLYHFLLERRQIIDYRSDLVVITSSNAKGMVKSLLPFEMNSLPKATRTRVQEMQRQWGIKTGDVVEFQMSQLPGAWNGRKKHAEKSRRSSPKFRLA